MYCAFSKGKDASVLLARACVHARHSERAAGGGGMYTDAPEAATCLDEARLLDAIPAAGDPSAPLAAWFNEPKLRTTVSGTAFAIA
eukprot:CAMPEP_0170328854 /NCGR_PEP_ID=MMETSP0116_2-20130129/65341_1 /TAXON_ID=400756 /ORGANISM="Durinskia baltica, Strain CSIRO CS-38" /LENGTH=85 /DNA_ID=CAMNT_0010581985 /DNA_START=132 /DNA_END=385 /DNA_ORIENTATION=+